MHFNAIFILGALIIGAQGQGFTIPKGQGNGIYLVHDDPNTPPGVLNFTQIGEIPPNTKRGLSFTDVPSAKSYQRENLPAGSTVTCGNNVLTQLDVTGAIEALKTQCGPDNNMALVKKNSHLYAQNNHVAAYFCNFKKNTDAHCGSADVDDAMTKIQKECNTRNQGILKAGYIRAAGGWNDGYGYDVWSQTLCKDGNQ